MSFWEVKLIPGINEWRAHYAGRPRDFATGKTPEEALHSLRMLNLSQLRAKEDYKDAVAAMPRRKPISKRIIASIAFTAIVILAIAGYSILQTSLSHTQPQPKTLYYHRSGE